MKVTVYMLQFRKVYTFLYIHKFRISYTLSTIENQIRRTFMYMHFSYKVRRDIFVPKRWSGQIQEINIIYLACCFCGGYMCPHSLRWQSLAEMRQKMPSALWTLSMGIVELLKPVNGNYHTNIPELLHVIFRTYKTRKQFNQRKIRNVYI
jgi:hypothetical protein